MPWPSLGSQLHESGRAQAVTCGPAADEWPSPGEETDSKASIRPRPDQLQQFDGGLSDVRFCDILPQLEPGHTVSLGEVGVEGHLGIPRGVIG